MSKKLYDKNFNILVLGQIWEFDSAICFIFVLIRFNGISECFCDDFGYFNDSSRSYFTDCWDVSGSRR